MNVVCMLEDVFEGGLVEFHAGDVRPHVGGELALPQGHDHCWTTWTVKPLFTDVTNESPRQLTGFTGEYP